jgi:hypothetical protein
MRYANTAFTDDDMATIDRSVKVDHAPLPGQRRKYSRQGVRTWQGPHHGPVIIGSDTSTCMQVEPVEVDIKAAQVRIFVLILHSQSDPAQFIPSHIV